MENEKNFELEENVQNLFKELLLLDDIEGERELLQRHGVNVDEKSLEVFHRKKKELFAFVQENRDELSNLNVEDLKSVTGGHYCLLTFRQLFAALGKAFAFVIGGYLHGSKSFLTVAFDGMLASFFANEIANGFEYLGGNPNKPIVGKASGKSK